MIVVMDMKSKLGKQGRKDMGKRYWRGELLECDMKISD